MNIRGKALSSMPQRRRNHAIWLGVLLALVGMFTYLQTVGVPTLRDFPWINLPLMVVGIIVSAIGLWRAIQRPSVYRGKILGTIGLVISVGLTGLFCFGLFYLAKLPQPTETILSLSAAPNFTLMDQRGQPVRLSDYHGRKVVLTFYRGYW